MDFREMVGPGALRKVSLRRERHGVCCLRAESLVASRSFAAEALEANQS